MTDTALVVRNGNTTLAPESTKTLWMSAGDKAMTPEHARVLAMIGDHYQLDPAIGEIIVLGGKAYITAEGYVTLAERHSQYNGMELWPLSEAERKAIKAGPDDHAWGCRIHRKDRPFPVVGYGVANPVNIQMSTIKVFARELAETRAIRRAMRLTFRVNVPDRDFLIDTEDAAELAGLHIEDTNAGFAPPAEPSPDWATFWAQAANYGLSDDDVHGLLGVASMKDWNHPMSEAVRLMDAFVAKRDMPPHVDPDEGRERTLDEMRAEYRGLMDKANTLGQPIEVGKTSWDREELAGRLAKARLHVRGIEAQIDLFGAAAQ